MPRATVGKISYWTTEMAATYLCWVCHDITSEVKEGVQCQGCGKWSHPKCVGLNKTWIQGVNKSTNVLIHICCTACGNSEKRRVDKMNQLMTQMVETTKEMKKELTEVKEEIKEER